MGRRRITRRVPPSGGCHAWGHTHAEALASIRAAIELYVEDLRERARLSLPIPSRAQPSGPHRLWPSTYDGDPASSREDEPLGLKRPDELPGRKASPSPPLPSRLCYSTSASDISPATSVERKRWRARPPVEARAPFLEHLVVAAARNGPRRGEPEQDGGNGRSAAGDPIPGNLIRRPSPQARPPR